MSEQEEHLERLPREELISQPASPDETSGLPPAGVRIERFIVKRGGRTQFVKATDIDWLESDGNYVNLHVGKAAHLVRGTIAACAERLDPRQFVRIHRRFIVNVDRVKEVQPWIGGDYVVLLEDGHKLRLSRNFREHFRSRMMGD